METDRYISERDCVKALKSGDVKAFDILFTEYGKRLYHFSNGYLKSNNEAEEVVQEVFIRIWQNRKTLKPELSFKAYIFKIAYHYILELFAKAQNRKAYLHDIAEYSVTFDPHLDERLDYSALLSKVQKLIEELPERQKEILLKRKIEGIPVKEIAVQMNISPKTVENHLTQALKNIKKGLGEEEITEFLFFLLFVRC
uniref:RNA polymerase sigma factor n=1 Tax=uncultured Draconibacterium sp. TaxID=1573823 RepID=UPI0032166ECE